MGGHSLPEDPTLPLRQRDLVGSGCDAVPQRLHVVDLLRDGQIVEPRRWHRQGASHGQANLASQGGICRDLGSEQPSLTPPAPEARPFGRLRRMHEGPST